MNLNKAKIKGYWEVRCFGLDGILKWVERVHNLVTDEGLNHMLNTEFTGSTQISPWRLVLFEDDHTPLAGDTYAVPGFTEFEAYDEAVRPEFNETSSTAESISNADNQAVFSVNDTKTLFGAGLLGGGSAPDTKGNVAGGGTLFSSVKFGSSQGVLSGEVLNVSYTVTLEDDGV